MLAKDEAASAVSAIKSRNLRPTAEGVTAEVMRSDFAEMVSNV
jgi:hypothetical protein